MECITCKIKMKALANTIYFGVLIFAMEMINKFVPVVNELSTINSGSMPDLVGNLIITIVSYGILILSGLKLLMNFKSFRSEIKHKGDSKCSLFNPFC